MNPHQPNILMIVVDSARYDLLSCYGHARPTSPNVDELAERGLLFDCAIAPSAWTFPAMSSIFTGMLPTKHGAHDQHRVLDGPYPTLAELLAQHGYTTAAFSDVPYVGPMTMLDRGFQSMSNLAGAGVSFPSKIDKAVARVKRLITGAYQKSHESRVVFRETMNWIDARASSDAPFFLYVHSDEVHAPYLPPPKYRRMFSNMSHREMRNLNQDKQLYVGGALEMTDDDFVKLAQLYAAEMRHLDEWIGRLVTRLQRRDLLDNTVVVIFADHGDNFGEHGLMRHGLCLYETLIHVPLIITCPQRIKPARVTRMVQLIDLPPTLLALAGIDAPDAHAEFQGRDLITAVRSGVFAPSAVSELYRPTTGLFEAKVPDFMPEFRRKYDRILRAYRTESHKYIWSSNGQHELYNLVSDPREEDNLIQSDFATALDMQERLDEWLASFTHATTAEATDHDDGDGNACVTARLRDLGYIE
ncbi:MAG: sulfatase [Phycisphaerae bacterium]